MDNAALVAAAEALADRNEAMIERIDGRLRVGAYGPPADRASVALARAAAKVSLHNVYHFIFDLASQDDRVLEADEHGLAAVFTRFTESGLFPSARVKHARFGGGHVCVRYDLSQDGAGLTVLGGLTLSYVVKTERIDGRERRVLSLVHPSASVSHFEALVSEHYGFDVSRTLSPGPPAPYELYAFRNMHGGWVRRLGVHRPAAFLFWVSPSWPDPDTATEAPLAGIRVYIPNLRLDLPVLPDLGLNDLRTLQLASPMLRVDYVRGGRCPRWLRAPSEPFAMAQWEGMGPTPLGVREQFPDW